MGAESHACSYGAPAVEVQSLFPNSVSACPVPAFPNAKTAGISAAGWTSGLAFLPGGSSAPLG